jgi:hypothetical protein
MERQWKTSRGRCSPKREFGDGGGGGLNPSSAGVAPAAGFGQEVKGGRGGARDVEREEGEAGEKSGWRRCLSLLKRRSEGVEEGVSGPGRCHAARRWGRGPARLAGGVRSATARP